MNNNKDQSELYQTRFEKYYLKLVQDESLWDLSLAQALTNVCKTISAVLKVEFVSVWLIDNDSQLTLHYFHNPALEAFTHSIRSKENMPHYFAALNEERLVDAINIGNDVHTHELPTAYLQQLNIQSIMHGTLRKKGQLAGVICYEQTGSQRIWNESEKWLAISIADLISQRLTYADLQDSEKYYRDLSTYQQATFDGANYSIITTAIDGTFRTFNRAASQMLGYDKDELIGCATPALIHDPDEVVARASTLSEELGKTIEPGFEVFVAKAKLGIAEEREWTYIHKTGRRIPILLSVTALHDNSGDISGFLGIGIDISDRVLMQRDLREEEARYHLLFENSGDSIFVVHGENFVDCNPATLKLFNCTYEQIINQPPYRFSPEFQPDGSSSKDSALEKITAAFAGESQHFEWQHLRYDGAPFDAEVTLTTIDLKGESHLLATVRDISNRKLAEQALKQSKLKLEAKNQSLRLLNDLSERVHGSLSTDAILDEVIASLLQLSDTPKIAIYLMDESQTTLKLIKSHGFNDETLKAGQFMPLSGSLSGLALQEGKLLIAGNFEAEERLAVNIQKSLIKSGIKSGVSIPLIYQSTPLGCLNLVYQGTRVFSETEQETLSSIGKNLSVSLANSQHMDKLDFLAHHDPLTGLSNRALLHDTFNQAIHEQPDQPMALILLDLDRFKDVNDTLGHHVGDTVLQQIGPRIQQCMSQYKVLLSRLGGDEFTVLIYDVSDPMEINKLANNIIEHLRQPYPVELMTLEVDVSMGIALYPKDGKDSHALLRSADIAMYQAKHKGGGISYYEQDTDIYTKERLSLMAEIMGAISEGQLMLHYQPKYDLSHQKITGFEALVRWQHPQLGLLYPDKFLPMAEVSESIHYITENVLQIALSQQQQWRQAGKNYSVAVNLSARNLIDSRCVEKVKSLMAQYETPAGALELELTESALMVDPNGAITLLQDLSALGVKLSIDDFGTGYSSLAYLRKLPLNNLKIDRTFVKDLMTNEQDAIIVKSTISLAHNLNLKVIAEGVEDQETQEQLEKLNCDLVQGYHISKPKDWDSLVKDKIV